MAITGNDFKKNFGGFGQGLIDIFGMTQVFFYNNNFTENGENVLEVVEKLREAFRFVGEPLNSGD